MPTPPTRRRPTLAAALLLAMASGCYTHDGLIDQARSRAIRGRVDEIDLGSYRVTLPRDAHRGDLTEIDIHVFGESERYKVNEIEAEVEELTPQLKDRALRVLRKVDRAELAEPGLESLRAKLLAMFNGVLTDEPIESIGFYDVRFIRH